jgi:hypothetical protein
MTYLNPHIELREDGNFYLIDLPEMPLIGDKNSQWYKDTGGYLHPDEWFKKAKSQALKYAVEIKDQVLANKLIDTDDIVYKKNHPYKVDLSGYDVKIERTCICTFNIDSMKCRDCADNNNWKQVAIITPKAMKEEVKSIVDHDRFYEIEKIENSSHSFTDIWLSYDLTVRDLGESLGREQFTLTRRKK